MTRIYRSKFLSRLSVGGIGFFFIVYIIVYSLSYFEYSKNTLELKQTNIKCLNKICVEYAGITECIDINDAYIFKVQFNENFNISPSNKTYSIELNSLGKKCSD